MIRTIIVIEHMPKRERVLPTKIWRVAERKVTEKLNGQTKMLSHDWVLIKRDLTLTTALHELKCERIKRVKAAEMAPV